jgi:hypothetical protein
MYRKARVDIIREIQEVGYLTEIDAARVLNLPKLTVECNLTNSFAFGWGGGSGLILELRILADRSTYIAEFREFELAGEVWDVRWMEEESPLYKFCRGLDFPRDVVLNHRVGKHGLVKPAIPLEGLLLGTCSQSVPPHLRRSDLSARLSILDGFQTCHRNKVSLWFDPGLVATSKRRHSSLYEPEDVLGCCAPDNLEQTTNSPPIDEESTKWVKRSEERPSH